MHRPAVLIVNLGTPDAPTPEAVGRYLRQFLMDPYVIDIPYLLRWFLVNIIIVPRRKKTSAELYQNIWSETEGSPLLWHSQNLVAKLQTADQSRLVALAMRYGQPDIQSAMQALVDQGATEIAILPVYPQYALASVETCLVACRQAVAAIGFAGPVHYYSEFYDQEPYIRVLATTIQETLTQHKPDFLLYSYHGLPEHQVAATGTACAFNDACCSSFREHSPKCYRAQCFATTQACNQRLDWPADKTTTAFQSRLGNRPWVKPYAEEMIDHLAKQGVKRLAVASPAFTADCLETLEEIKIRFQEDFIASGGEEIILVPSLNDRDDWVSAVLDLLAQQQKQPLNA